MIRTIDTLLDPERFNYAALCILVCSLPFVDLEVFRVGGKSIVLPYLACAALIVPLLRRPTLLSPLVTDPTLPYLLAWFGIAVISTALSVLYYRDEPFLGWERAAFQVHNATQTVNVGLMVAQYALCLCALSAVTASELDRLIRLFIAVGAVLAVYSLYQIGTVLFGWPLVDVFRTSNLYLKAPTLHPEGYGSWIKFPRTYGTAPEPSMWGGYLIVVIGFVLGRIRHRLTIEAVLVLAVLGAGVLFTFSRSAWLSLMILGSLWLLSFGRSGLPKLVWPALIVMILLYTFAPAVLVRETSALGFRDLSALDRMSANMTGLNVFFDHPVLGVGLGSFRFFIDKYLFSMAGYTEVLFFTVFNYFLLVFVSTGLVGGALFVGFVSSLSRRIARSRETTGSLGAVQLGAALATVSVFTFWLNTPAYNFSYIWFCFAVASVLPVLLSRAQHAEGVMTPSRREPDAADR